MLNGFLKVDFILNPLAVSQIKCIETLLQFSAEDQIRSMYILFFNGIQVAKQIVPDFPAFIV